MQSKNSGQSLMNQDKQLMLMEETRKERSRVTSSSSSSVIKPKKKKGKIFECRGYGNCAMVFTRAEHLLRHMRKHTGEKPFPCAWGCGRSFSRFDNMMQHTQTHSKNKTSLPVEKKKKASKKEKKDVASTLPTPPISRRNSAFQNQIILPQPVFHPNFYPHHQALHPPVHENLYARHYHPLDPYPASPPSSVESIELPAGPVRRRSAPLIRYLPYPPRRAQSVDHQEVLPILRRDSALTSLADYLIENPDKTPESYRDYAHRRQVPAPTRRLSIQDLINPIEELEQKKDTIESEGIIDLTEDEYQAIQGFGRLHKTAILYKRVTI